MNKLPFYLKQILVFLTAATLLLTLFSKCSKENSYEMPPTELQEKFDPRFLSINSCERLDSLISREFVHSNYDTARTVRYIDEFLRNRFYHSYSELSMKNNWIAHLCGKLFWSDFLFPVRPCDIIMHPMAACSQQGILFQQQLNQLNIPCSTIEFLPLSKTSSGHYAVSVYYDNAWHYYDSNQEPLIIDSTMPSITQIVDSRLYEKMYVTPSNKRFQEFFKAKSYKEVNKVPFSKGEMHYFQSITAFLSNWLWALLLALSAVLHVLTRNRKTVQQP